MKKSFHLGLKAQQVLLRTGKGADSSRLNAVLDRFGVALADVDIGLSEAELQAVTDAHWSHAFMDAEIDKNLWMNVEDMLGEGLAEKHGIDGPALVAKLKGISAIEAVWLIEEIERRRGLSEK